ncbi:MAG: hypothetical protein SCJ93_11615 [Bacillota bacterium]|nr:hypothetical protein [Bacillota bacterium]
MKRGRRIVKRVLKDGLELSALNYLPYVEWRSITWGYGYRI